MKPYYDHKRKRGITPDEYYAMMREYTEAAKPIIKTYTNYMSLQIPKLLVSENGQIQNVYDEKTLTFMSDILKVLEVLRESVFARAVTLLRN